LAAKKKSSNVTKKKTSKKKAKKKVVTRARRDCSSVAARNRRMRVEALIDEAKARAYLLEIEKALIESDSYKKLIENSITQKEFIKESLQAFDFLDDDLNKKEFNNCLHNAIKNIVKAQHNELTTAVVKAEAITKINKLIIDTNFRRLNKIFPDMKSIEVSDPDGNNPMAAFAAVLTEAAKS